MYAQLYLFVNLGPWMSMKQPYSIMPLLIPSLSYPDNHINVYLRPLNDELKELWDKGVKMYSAHTDTNFCMCATFFGLSSIFLHMPCYLVGAQKDK